MNSITNMEVAERMLAEAAVVADIECEGISVSGGSTLPRTWDVRPMLDVREHHPISIDMNALGLAYAEWRGLIQVLERDANHQPVLVRIIRSPA